MACLLALVALVAYVYVGYPAAACMCGPAAGLVRLATTRPTAEPDAAACRSSSPRATKARRLAARLDNLLQPRLSRRPAPDHRRLRRIDRRHARRPGPLRRLVDAWRCRPAARRWRSTPASRARRRDRRLRRRPAGVRARRAARAGRAVRRSAGRRGHRRAACSTAKRADRTRRDRRSARPTPDRRSRRDAERRARRASAAARCSRRSPTASGCTGGTRSRCAGSRAAIGSTLGATGAIYAMRRSLWRPLPPTRFSTMCWRRCGACWRATASCSTSGRARSIAPRPTPTPRRGARSGRSPATTRFCRSSPRLLLPWRNRVWLQYLSHKVGRLLVPYALLALMAPASCSLSARSSTRAALAAQCAFYLLAAYGAWLDFERISAAVRQSTRSMAERQRRRRRVPGARRPHRLHVPGDELSRPSPAWSALLRGKKVWR